LGTRRITAITGIKSEGNGTQSVEFTWEWVPTSLPADAAAEDFQYFGTFREFRTPLTGYSTFEKYDDGWRLRYATYTNVPPA
jgi:hypothetical protein